MNTANSKFPGWLALASTLLLLCCSNDEPETATASDSSAASGRPAAAGIESNSVPPQYPDVAASERIAGLHGRRCGAGQVTPECLALRSLLVVDVVMALDGIQRSRDQRGTEEAMAALDLTDEPEILIAACRVLGSFPDTPGIAEKVTPLLLDSPFLAVERVAAEVLGNNPDPAAAAMASQWSANHGELWTDDPYQLAPDFPEHYFDMGFPEYPGAEWFSPADSDRSVGWRVAGAPAEVSAALAGELDVEVMNWQQWLERSAAEMTNAYQMMMNRPEAGELQQLMEKYMQSQDPALADRIQKLQDEMSVYNQQFEDDQKKALSNVLTPPGGVAMEDVYYLVAEERAGHIARAILVYRAGPERTVMQMAWDLRDYPPAWEAAR